MAGSNPSENIDYHSAQTQTGDGYKWMAVFRSMGHNPYSYRPDARFDPFRPRVVMLPWSEMYPYYDAAVSQALTQNTERMSAVGIQVQTQYPGAKGHYPVGRQYMAPSRFFIHEDDFGEWDLTGQVMAGEPNPEGNGAMSNGLNYWDTISLQQTDYEIQPIPSGGLPPGDVLMANHPTAGLVPQQYGFFNNGYAHPVGTVWADVNAANVCSAQDFANRHNTGTLLMEDVTWLGYDTVSNEWITHIFGSDAKYVWRGGFDAPFLVANGFGGVVSVKRFGDDFYDINMCMQFQTGTGDMAFGSARQAGSTYYKSVFPDKSDSHVPLRYVRFHRPQHSVSSTTSASLTPPLYAHPGFSHTVCCDDYTERVVLDNKLDGGERILLFGDRTLVDLVSTSTTATVEARRLRLPNPTIEDSLRVTLPWNPTEEMQFDRAHGTYDFAISSKDLQTWRARCYGKNSNTTEDVWATLSVDPPSVWVEYGMISRRLVFTGRMPYVRQTHSNGTF